MDQDQRHKTSAEQTHHLRFFAGDAAIPMTQEQLQSLIRQRAAEIFRTRQPWEGDQLSDWLQAETEILGKIEPELREREQRYEIHATIEGFKADDLDIAVEPGHVTVRGLQEERTLDEVSELPCLVHTEFIKVMALPGPVELEACEATLTGNKLLIVLPKRGVLQDPERLEAP